MSRSALSAAYALLLALAASVAAADLPGPLYDGEDGATCRYFNLGARIPWRHKLGDWRDAAGRSQGDVPYGRAVIDATDTSRTIEWDVTRLVRGWLENANPNHGLLLDTVKGGPQGTILFFSRESNLAAVRPRLTITLADTREQKSIGPVADSWLDCSTVMSLGSKEELHVGGGARSALQFDLKELGGRRIARAVLVLTTTEKQYGNATIGVFRLDPPARAPSAAPARGIAAAYPGDRGIGKHPAVVFATGFESPGWRSEWSYLSAGSHADRVIKDTQRGFEPLLGYALRVEIPQGDNLGLDMGFNFKEKLDSEPEEIYFRYYLRLAEDWLPSVDGGKLPGLAGTYGRAGWGGRKANAREGWSMRGLFHRAATPDNPLHKLTAIGTYAYHADSEDVWGDDWDWTEDTRGLLERNRWYCIEQYFKVNTPGSKDGVLRAWVDGALAFERTDIRVRDIPEIKIEQVWMNVYHGGTAKAPQDLHLYLDNIVVARMPIGCVSR